MVVTELAMIRLHRRLATKGLGAETADRESYVSDDACRLTFEACPAWYRAGYQAICWIRAPWWVSRVKHRLAGGHPWWALARVADPEADTASVECLLCQKTWPEHEAVGIAR